MLYKGCEKRMINVKNTGSELFEEAYFIINTKHSARVSHTDMIKEANRLVAENTIALPTPKKPKNGIMQYIIGFLSGVGAAAIIMAVII